MNFTKVAGTFLLVFVLSVAVFSEDRALIIGIDEYKGSPDINPIQGGIADARAMESLIQRKFGFSRSSIRTLLGSQATAFGIKDSVQNWLINGTKPGDRIFFFYSGHGARVADQDGDETEDQRDEVIAPYDIEVNYINNKPAPKNFIRDDEVNEWLAALAGRQVVMVFDSCNSGTISRSLGKENSKFLNLEALPVTTRGGGDEVRSPKTRDLSTVIDKYMSDKTPNAVIISAAQANQTATWMDTNESKCNENLSTAKYRGALAYLFEKAFESSNPTLSQLESYLTNEMVRLQDAKIMCKSSRDEYQKPWLEFDSSLANQSLWGMNNSSRIRPNWEQSPATALLNPLSKMKVSLNFNSPGEVYRIDDDIQYSVSIEEPAYLYVLVFSENNRANVIFPYSENKSNFKQAGTHQFEAVAGEPLGRDVWVAIASKKRISALENLPDNEPFTWDELYSKIGLTELQTKVQEVARTRGAQSPGSKPGNTEWQSATKVMTTHPKR